MNTKEEQGKTNCILVLFSQELSSVESHHRLKHHQSCWNVRGNSWECSSTFFCLFHFAPLKLISRLIISEYHIQLSKLVKELRRCWGDKRQIAIRFWHSFYQIISTWRNNTDWFNCCVSYPTPSECLYSNLKMAWFARSRPHWAFTPHNLRKIIGYKYSKEEDQSLVSSGECQTTFRIWRSMVPSVPSPTWGDQLLQIPFGKLGNQNAKVVKMEDLHVKSSGQMFSLIKE